VRTLQHALLLARKVRQTKPDAAIVIELAAGEHRLSAPVVLVAEDSGTPARPLVIRGSADGATRILGSVPLVPAPDLGMTGLERLPAEARPHVRRYRMPASLSAARRVDVVRLHFRQSDPVAFEVFDQDGALMPARWPDEGWLRTAAKDEREGASSFQAAERDRARLVALRGEPDLWAGGYWRYDWGYETQPVAAFDPDNLRFDLGAPAHYGFRQGGRYRLYHALAALDRPGEWHRDPASNVLTLWPRRDDGAGIEVSVTDSAFVLQGASHVRLEHLTIERFRGNAIVVRGGTGVIVERSVLRWIAGRGVSFERGSNSGVRASTLTDIGEGAVLLSGGNRKTLLPGGLFVARSELRRFSRLGRTYKPAVELLGVGHSVSGNLMAGSPSMAIHVWGNDHVIELNEITDVATETHDAGAIYSWQDWTQRGTIIRHNFFHDIKTPAEVDPPEVKGVYLDDLSSGFRIEGNLFLRVEHAVFIGGGRDNVVERNVMIACEPGIYVDARAVERGRQAIDDPRSDIRRKLAAMPYRSPAWMSRYPELALLLESDPASPRGNILRGNLSVGGPRYFFEPDVDRTLLRFGPEHGEDHAGAVNIEVQARANPVVAARSAGEVARLLAADLQKAGLLHLPLGLMDRGPERSGVAAR
jgi:hypothetical protein